MRYIRADWLCVRAVFCGWLFVAAPMAISSEPVATSNSDASTAWQAEWMSAKGVLNEAGEDGKVRKPNQWLAFRKTVELASAPKWAPARIACDSKYWLWVNGKLVVFEGGLKRGPNPRDTYFDRIDLAPHLKAGENTIAVLVWYFGRQGMSHNDSGQAGLVFQAEVDGVLVQSDANWKAITHPAYGPTGPPHPNWRLPESNIRFEAQRDLADWFTPGFDDSDWPAPQLLGRPPTAPWNQLIERPLPAWRDLGLREYENKDALPSVSTGAPIIATLPYNAQVTPYLEVDAKAGQRIRIRTDNYRGGSEPNVRAVYLTRQGRQTYESLGWMNGHQVVYELPAGVKILSLKYRETGYDTDLSGSFKCDDDRLNTLWKKAQRTLYVNMRDTYFDCPGRERAQWWGDVTLEIQQSFYGLDRQSDQLSRKAILDLACWQKPHGALFSPVPAGNWEKELPMQMLASVGRFGFWEYYRHTGDRDTIEKVYPAVTRYLKLWKLQDNGLVVQRKGDWTWGDWGTNKDLPLLYNAWYFLALDGQARMAQLLGDTQQAATCRDKMRKIRGAFNRDFWTSSGYRSASHQGPLDDRGNALAIVAGIADTSKHDVIAHVLKTEQHASPYMEKYVLQALLEMGHVNAALDRMLDRFGPMIDASTSTLWEGWGVGAKGFGGGSYNHAWSGGPLTLLSQYIAGIDPIEVGYKKVKISPRWGRLKQVSARLDAPQGPIEVRFEIVDQDLRGSILIPAGITAELELPYSQDAKLTWSSEPLAKVPVAGEMKAGMKVENIEGGSLSIQLQSGKHAVHLELR